MGVTWPGWKNEALLGEGSFGRVYQISKEEFGTRYEAALKVISIPQTESDIEAAYAEGMDEASVTEYFKSCMEDIVAEFALMSQLKGNSNIVSYEDHMVVQHEDGIGWDILIRMELLTPLVKYIAKNTFTQEEVIRLGIDLSRALELCQKCGILHRDIKPENIFISKNGDFKLGDFGVARVAEKTISAMSRKGTYTYMAPEVYKGEEYGFSADLYSLGIVLYRFLNNNRTPFLPEYPKPIQFKDREEALNDRIMGKDIPMPAKGRKELKEIVMKACAFNPSERFQNAGELEDALTALLPPKGHSMVAGLKEEDKEEKSKTIMENVTEEEEKEGPLDRTVSFISENEEKNIKDANGLKEIKERQELEKESKKAEVPEDGEGRKQDKKNLKIFFSIALLGSGIAGALISFIVGIILEEEFYEYPDEYFGIILLGVAIAATAGLITSGKMHKISVNGKWIPGDVILEVILGNLTLFLATVGHCIFYIVLEAFDFEEFLGWSSYFICFLIPYLICMILSGLILLGWSRTLRRNFINKSER